jgi:hypothetical protein
MEVDLRFDNEKAVLEAINASERFAKAGLKRAANRAATRLRARATKGIGQQWRLKASYIRSNLQVGRDLGGAPRAYVRARRRPTLTSRFPHRQVYRSRGGKRVKAGISVRIRRGRGPQRIHSGFLVRLKRGKADNAGRMGIAVRTKVLRELGYTVDRGAVGSTGDRQYQILHTTSVLEMFRWQVEQMGLDEEVRAYFLGQVNKEMERAIARARA